MPKIYACLLLLLAATPAQAGIFAWFDNAEPVVTGTREMSVAAAPDGMYYVRANVNGVAVKFVVDTGSDDIVLSRKDAQRAGIDLASLQYSDDYDAATGGGMEAETTVRKLVVGPAAFADVPVSISHDSGGASLLGMAFLHRLQSIEMTHDHLYLHW